ncbi:rhodanese-like domain-containing protein [uncultured Thermanaerothrix sp.]|uniref:rhodanese-like domain-containing protein n=1 Tax=uncultured Thermanaerothrix sp. TaxID=1195149 RepID=UPI002624712F|nr:rhodanese-like domain-containing protein [uncultured Thermanaerothrix sp.]
MTKRSTASASIRKQRTTLPVWLWLVGVVLLGLGALLIPTWLSPRTTSALPLEVDVRQAAALRDQGALVLDVREPEEWAEVHIPGALLIPLGQLAARVDELPRDRAVVVVCRSGNRSQEGRDILRRAGFSQVTSLQGGIRAWVAAGLPTVSGP